MSLVQVCAAVFRAVDAPQLEVADVHGATVRVYGETGHVGVGQAAAARSSSVRDRPSGRARPSVAARIKARLARHDRHGVDLGVSAALRSCARSPRRRRSSRGPSRVASRTDLGSSGLVASALTGPSIGPKVRCQLRPASPLRDTPSGVAASRTPARETTSPTRGCASCRVTPRGRRLHSAVASARPSDEEPLVGAGQDDARRWPPARGSRAPRARGRAGSRDRAAWAPPGRRRAADRPRPRRGHVARAGRRRCGRRGARRSRCWPWSTSARDRRLSRTPAPSAPTQQRAVGQDGQGVDYDVARGRDSPGPGVVVRDPEPLGGARVEGVGAQVVLRKGPRAPAAQRDPGHPASTAKAPSVRAMDARAGGRKDALGVATVEREREDVRVVDHAAMQRPSR